MCVFLVFFIQHRKRKPKPAGTPQLATQTGKRGEPKRRERLDTHGDEKSSSTTDPQPAAEATEEIGVRRLKTARAFSL